MCIIVSKEKYKEIPKKEILQNCFENNPDGAGFMYVYNNKVHIEKGFMMFDSFYNRIMELDKKINLKKRSLVMHFRIGTSGKNDAETCHPFPISNDFDELRAVETTCQIGMVHNGIISSFAYDKVLSDTQNYVKDFVFNLYKLNKNFLNNKYTKNILNSSCNHTKLTFLDSNDRIYYFGDFVKDKNGIKYSNTTYEKSYYRTYTNYCNYDKKYYDYYDEWDEYDEIKDELTNNVYYMDKDDLVMLDSSMCYYAYGTKNADMVECNDDMCIDADYNLYEIIDNTEKFWKIKLIEVDVVVFDDQMEELTFKMLQKQKVK